MRFFLTFLRDKIRVFIVFTFIVALFSVSFYLYHLPLKAVIYPALLSVFIVTIYLICCFPAYKRRIDLLRALQNLPVELDRILPEGDSISTEYNELIRKLCDEQRRIVERSDASYSDMVAYYTVWAHQIKTPIASMRLHLQNEDSALSLRLRGDLGRIEGYVEMVLAFLRLDSDTNDFLIRRFDLDAVIRSTIRKFSGDFIQRKLRLDYEPIHVDVLSDEKWLSFIIGQLLSNALKYTPAGAVFIYVEGDDLCIRDTGIGIAPEDLPRIFENGYTGFNGHADSRSSGIGLYLCRRISRKLGHSLTVESTVGVGTTMRLCLKREKIDFE